MKKGGDKPSPYILSSEKASKSEDDRIAECSQGVRRVTEGK